MPFADALAAWAAGRYDGIGFVFSADDPYTGVDLDHVRDADTGVVQPWALDIVRRLDSYTEISPSGGGLHVIVRAQVPRGRKKFPQLGAEMYDRARYFTMTGNVFAGVPV